jgi:SAM-dependent methyltransferase
VRPPAPTPGTVARQFRSAYAAHRAAEGRGAGGDAELLALPYLRSGPVAGQWSVRARTFDRFVRAVIAPLTRGLGRPLAVLDLGAGNGWLCHRLCRDGHRTVALDLRNDDVDGLGAAAAYERYLDPMFGRVVASFEALPLASRTFDVAAFNAALHYATDLRAALSEAARVVRPGGQLAILDSPFYRRRSDGEAMVAAKRRDGARTFGAQADRLLSLPFIEYLTPDGLRESSLDLGLAWRRHRVRYPLRYELRPMVAAARGRRTPSRFDLWTAAVG